MFPTKAQAPSDSHEGNKSESANKQQAPPPPQTDQHTTGNDEDSPPGAPNNILHASNHVPDTKEAMSRSTNDSPPQQQQQQQQGTSLTKSTNDDDDVDDAPNSNMGGEEKKTASALVKRMPAVLTPEAAAALVLKEAASSPQTQETDHDNNNVPQEDNMAWKQALHRFGQEEKQRMQNEEKQWVPVPSPSSRDVLCGRGMGSRYTHPGNQVFRELCASRLDEYRQTNKRTNKSRIVKEIVQKIYDLGGRFLVFSPTGEALCAVGRSAPKPVKQQWKPSRKKLGMESEEEQEDDEDEHQEGPPRGCWYQASCRVAREKVGHTLRDAVSDKNKAILEISRRKKKRNDPDSCASSRAISPVPDTDEQQQDLQQRSIIQNTHSVSNGRQPHTTATIMMQQQEQIRHQLALQAKLEQQQQIKKNKKKQQQQQNSQAAALMALGGQPQPASQHGTFPPRAMSPAMAAAAAKNRSLLSAQPPPSSVVSNSGVMVATARQPAHNFGPPQLVFPNVGGPGDHDVMRLVTALQQKQQQHQQQQQHLQQHQQRLQQQQQQLQQQLQRQQKLQRQQQQHLQQRQQQQVPTTEASSPRPQQQQQAQPKPMRSQDVTRAYIAVKMATGGSCAHLPPPFVRQTAPAMQHTKQSAMAQGQKNYEKNHQLVASDVSRQTLGNQAETMFLAKKQQQQQQFLLQQQQAMTRKMLQQQQQQYLRNKQQQQQQQKQQQQQRQQKQQQKQQQKRDNDGHSLMMIQRDRERVMQELKLAREQQLLWHYHIEALNTQLKSLTQAEQEQIAAGASAPPPTTDDMAIHVAPETSSTRLLLAPTTPQGVIARMVGNNNNRVGLTADDNNDNKMMMSPIAASEKKPTTERAPPTISITQTPRQPDKGDVDGGMSTRVMEGLTSKAERDRREQQRMAMVALAANPDADTKGMGDPPRTMMTRVAKKPEEPERRFTAKLAPKPPEKPEQPARISFGGANNKDNDIVQKRQQHYLKTAADLGLLPPSFSKAFAMANPDASPRQNSNLNAVPARNDTGPQARNAPPPGNNDSRVFGIKGATTIDVNGLVRPHNGVPAIVVSSAPEIQQQQPSRNHEKEAALGRRTPTLDASVLASDGSSTSPKDFMMLKKRMALIWDSENPSTLAAAVDACRKDETADAEPHRKLLKKRRLNTEPTCMAANDSNASTSTDAMLASNAVRTDQQPKAKQSIGEKADSTLQGFRGKSVDKVFADTLLMMKNNASRNEENVRRSSFTNTSTLGGAEKEATGLKWDDDKEEDDDDHQDDNVAKNISSMVDGQFEDA